VSALEQADTRQKSTSTRTQHGPPFSGNTEAHTQRGRRRSRKTTQLATGWLVNLATMDVHVRAAMELVEISSLPDPQTGARHVDWHVELIIGERVE